MIEIYRFILALCVIQGHLLASGAPWLAWQAVFSFYVLSGFLMTLVLNQQYGFTAAGLARFAANRWLRLFPVYYLIIGLTAAYIAYVGPLSQLNAAMALPISGRAVVGNLAVVSLDGFDASHMIAERLSPTAWSLGIELCFYFLLAVYFAKSKPRLWVLLAGGIGLAAWQVLTTLHTPDYGFLDRYAVIQSGIIPFALGGLAYWFRESRFFAFSAWKLVLFAALFASNVALGFWSQFHEYVSGLYTAAALNFFFVPVVFRRAATAEWQRVLGGLSYPVFLSHMLIGTLIAIYFPALQPFGIVYCGLAGLASVLFCLPIYYAVDRPIQNIRQSVKTHDLLAPLAAIKGRPATISHASDGQPFISQ